jgi:hypothetical protein
MSEYISLAMRWIERMHTWQWVIVLAVAAAIGILSMRGFGTRTNY